MKIDIESLFPQFKTDLAQLIAIPSVFQEDDVTPFGPAIDQALDRILLIAESLGFEVYKDPNGMYAYADYGATGPLFGVLGHIDVVPPGALDAWDHDPFEMVHKDGFLYGRGTSDDKGPLLASMYGLKALVNTGVSLNGRVRFIFGADEESLWRCVKAYVEKEEIPEYGFTPDASFPLIYAEKGLLDFTLTSFEINPVMITGGDAFNAVPSSCRTPYDPKVIDMIRALDYEFSIDGDEIVVHGTSVHAKNADLGTNAIVRCAIALYYAGHKSHLVKFIREIAMDPHGVKIFGEQEDPDSGKLMFNIGKIETTSQKQTISVDIRYPVSVERAFVEESLKRAAHQYEVVAEVYDALPSVFIDRNSEFIKTLMTAYQSVSGDYESVPKSTGGATYARALPNFVAFGALMPGAPATEHQVNERISVDGIKQAMAVYAEAFRLWLGVSK